MKKLEITIDRINNQYHFSGDVEKFWDEREIKSYLKNEYDAYFNVNTIIVPYEEKNKEPILIDLQQLAEDFGFELLKNQECTKLMNSYEEEKKHFQESSEKAKKIRNNEFKENPELIEDFDNFQQVIKKELVRTLYPLQLLSAYHLAFAQHACNFAVPGAGKTSIVYGAYTYLKNLPKDHPKHIDKILVIGPLSSFAPWEDEYEKCFGRKAESQRVFGEIDKNIILQHFYSSNPKELTIISHAGSFGWEKEIIDFLKKNKTMVVIDEAHRIKNPEGRSGMSSIEIAKEAKSRVILTGTPVPNGYEDLYNLYQFIYPYKFKDILQFHYGNLADMTKTCDFDDERVKRFTKNISPYFIRIKKKDLDLPLVKNEIISVGMDEYQREIYDFIEAKYISLFQQNSSATIKDVLNKAKLIRLRQAATNPALLKKPIQETLNKNDYDSRMVLSGQIPEEFQDDSEILSKIYDYAKIAIPQKFKTVKEIAEKIIIEKGKIIIWTIFVQNAKGLQRYLFEDGIKSKLLIGEVEQSEREVIIKKFNDPENQDFQVVIANPFSVSESISLHRGCHNAVYMERDYNCSNFLQSKDRIHRVGLLKNQETNYYYILSKDSIDEVIHERLNDKVERMEKIIDEDIPLFARINDTDETDIIKSLLESYAKRT